MASDPLGQEAQASGIKYCAVIMAGSRGENDPVARASGKSHKCLVNVAGIPMLTRVLQTVESSPHVGRVVLCVEASLQGIPAIIERTGRDSFECLDAAGSPAASALRACEKYAGRLPLLIITADHPLLNSEMLDHFCSRARGRSDICVGLARADLVAARFPRSNRTLLRFSDAAYCGCNMFALNTPRASIAVAFWTRLESERKRPWRMIRMLGVGSLLRYLCRRLTLGDALASFSHKLGLEARAIDMPFAEAAIDVDKLSDLELVETIFTARAEEELGDGQASPTTGHEST